MSGRAAEAMRNAIRSYCMDCMGTRCDLTCCSLYPYRIREDGSAAKAIDGQISVFDFDNGGENNGKNDPDAHTER